MAIDSGIEFAWGADLSANPATWTWTDESIRARGSVSRQFGRQDETSQTQPSTVSLRLDNIDSRYSPRHPLSALYPNVRRQTPVRVSLNPGTGSALRFQGYVDQIVPVWPSGESGIAEVEVTASGILRRLGQGRSPLKSALYRALTAAAPYAYWPLEDGPQADQIAGVAGGVAVSLVRLMATGPAEFGAVRPATGATTMPSFIRGGALDLQVSSGISSAWTVELALFFGTGEPAAGDYSIPSAMNVFKVYASNGDYWELQLSPHNATFTNGRVALFRSDEPEAFFDTLVDSALGSFNPWDGQTHHAAVTASQSGGNIAWQLILDGSVYASGTLAGRTLQPVNMIRLNQNGFLASSSTYGLGHVAMFESVVSVTSHASAAAGWIGELATSRLTRLCAEQGVALALAGASPIAMGPQGTDTFLSLLRECEAADGGILYDGEGPGLAYRAEDDRTNVSVAMALDCGRGHVKVPFQPAEDDQRIGNDWTVSRPGGSFSHQVDAAHIAVNSAYDDSASVNVAADDMLADQASWRVSHGTVEEMRVPGIALQLIDHPELWSAWLGMTLSDRMTVASLPTQYPPGVLDVILEGGVEVWDAVSWTVDVNTSPFAPWRVAVFAADVGDVGEFVGRFDTAGCVLPAAVTAAAATALVGTTSGPLWTAVADDLPFDVGISGQQNRVSAVASAVTDGFARSVSSGWGAEPTSGVVWAVTGTASDYAVAAGVGTQSNGSVGTLRQSTLDIGSTIVDFTADVSVPVTSALTQPITQWVCGRYAGANDYYIARLDLTVGVTSLGVWKRVGGVLTNLVPQATAGTGHVSGEIWRVRLQIIGSAIQAKAWLAAAAEPDAFQAATTDTDLTTGTQIALMSRLETGNTNVTPVVVAWDNVTVTNPQRFTFSARGVNGVTKALPSGSAVSLWAPLVFAK